jgi:hypothetical protein
MLTIYERDHTRASVAVGKPRQARVTRVLAASRHHDRFCKPPGPPLEEGRTPAVGGQLAQDLLAALMKRPLALWPRRFHQDEVPPKAALDGAARLAKGGSKDGLL